MAVTYSTLVPTSKRFIDISGQKFGRLIAKTALRKSGHTGAFWLCGCDCGGSAIVSAHRLRHPSGTRSCGCIWLETMAAIRTKHGRCKSPTHRSWMSMKQRCGDPANRWYGARGIAFDPAWSDFRAFFADMGERPDGTELDRINPDGDYCKANCRWITHQQNTNNTRANRILRVNGRDYTVAEASREFGIRASTIYQRLNMGWDEQRAATQALTKA